MTKIDAGFHDISRLDTLAAQDSWVHRLDPRAKVLVTAFFVIVVVSFDRYAISQLLPYFLFPVLLVVVADLPLCYFLRKLLLLAPFVLFVGIFNPFFDRTILLYLGPVPVSGGWISFVSIILRFVLSASAALILIATSGFAAVCMALDRLGCPKIFTVQLLFLYRYIFVLIDEGGRMVRARAMRSFGSRGAGLRVFGQLLGNLLLRTLDRGQRIHMAMQCRGFSGEIRLNRRLKLGRPEFYYLAAGIGLFTLLRVVNVPQLLGTFILELLG